jgi:Protein of unknown function (DUF2516)
VLAQALDADFAYSIESTVALVLWFVLLAVKLFALIDALFHSDRAYVAADKQNKAFWLLLLVIFLALHILIPSPIQVLNLIGTVAAFVYLADVRPTLRSMKQY